MDTNGSGFINATQLKLKTFEMGFQLSEEEIEKMVECCDKDGKGEISFEQYAALVPCFDVAAGGAASRGKYYSKKENKFK